MFESGPGGDFATYIGNRTGAIYRLDLGKVHYQKMKLDDLLFPAIEREDQLRRIPEEIQCKLCGNIFTASSISIESEEQIEAYEL